MPTLAELLASPIECPTFKPRPLDAYDVELQVPATGMPGDRYALAIRGGIFDRPGGGRCGIVTATTTRSGVTGEAAQLSTDSSCIPAPEPTFAAALLFGVLWLGVAGSLGSVIGRRLKRQRKRYSKRRNAPEP